jgi:hypothetical protein
MPAMVRIAFQPGGMGPCVVGFKGQNLHLNEPVRGFVVAAGAAGLD